MLRRTGKVHTTRFYTLLCGFAALFPTAGIPALRHSLAYERNLDVRSTLSTHNIHTHDLHMMFFCILYFCSKGVTGTLQYLAACALSDLVTSLVIDCVSFSLADCPVHLLFDFVTLTVLSRSL